MIYLLALLIGVVAGLRAMTAPAAVSLGRLSRLAAARRQLGWFMGHWYAVASSACSRSSNWSPTSCRDAEPQGAAAVRRAASSAARFAARPSARGRRADRRPDRRRHRRGDRHARRRMRRAAAGRRDRRPRPAGRADRGRRRDRSARCWSSRRWHEQEHSTPSSSAPARPARRWPAG